MNRPSSGASRKISALGVQRARLRVDAADLDIPTLVLLAGEDRVVSTEVARELAGVLPAATVIEYPGAFHGLLHDPLAPQVMDDLVAWARVRTEVRSEA